MYLNTSKTPLLESVEMIHLEERKNLEVKIVGSIPLRATTFSPPLFACWCTSLQLETHSQNDWSIKNQIHVEYTGLRQGFHN